MSRRSVACQANGRYIEIVMELVGVYIYIYIITRWCIYIYINNQMVYIYIIIIWLVVWNMFYFSIAYIYIYVYIWDVILPIDELHHFSRWLKPPFLEMMVMDENGWKWRHMTSYTFECPFGRGKNGWYLLEPGLFRRRMKGMPEPLLLGRQQCYGIWGAYGAYHINRC